MNSRKSRASKKGGKGKKKPAANKKSRQSRQSRQSRKSRKSNILPRTAKILTREIAERERFSRASSSMTLSDLQFMAKSFGIPFGGLSKTKLVRKINNYY